MSSSPFLWDGEEVAPFTMRRLTPTLRIASSLPTTLADLRDGVQLSKLRAFHASSYCFELVESPVNMVNHVGHDGLRRGVQSVDHGEPVHG